MCKLKIIVFRLCRCPDPDQQQRALCHGNSAGLSCEAVADPQGEAAGEGGVFQFVLGTMDADAFGISAHAEYAEVAGKIRRQGDGVVTDGGDDLSAANQIAPAAPVCQKLHGLEIGHGVIHPGTVQSAVEIEAVTAHFQTLFDGQHGVGIVFFHGKHFRPFRGVAQRVKIPQDDVWFDLQPLQMGQAAIGGDDSVFRGNGKTQPIPFARAENNAFFHIGSPQWAYFDHFIIKLRETKAYNRKK